MSDVYAPKRARVAAILKRWKTGVVVLKRTTIGASAPTTPWIPGTLTTEVFVLDARVDGAPAEYVNETTILATDLMAIVSPKVANEDGAIIDIVPRMSDTLTIDGADKVIKKIEAVPAAGVAARFHIFVAS